MRYPSKGGREIFSPFFSKRQKQRTNEQMVRLALLPRLSFFHEFFSCATPLRGAGKIFRPFFSKRQKQRTNEQMVRLALFPRLSLFPRNFFKQKLKFFITKAPLAFVCNPLARSAGIFSKVLKIDALKCDRYVQLIFATWIY